MPLPRPEREECAPYVDPGYRNYTDGRRPIDINSNIPENLCYPLCLLFIHEEKRLAKLGINYSQRENITKSIANGRMPEGFDSIESINEYIKALILATDPNYIFE